MFGRDKKNSHAGIGTDVQNDIDESSKINKLSEMLIVVLHAAVIKLKEETSNDKNIKNTDKAILDNLLNFLHEINSQVKQTHLKLELMQQAIINAYYAIRRTQCRSMVFFNEPSKIGDKLEKIAHENLNKHGCLLLIPHKVKPEMDTIVFVANSYMSSPNMHQANEMLKNTITEEMTIHDELSLKFAIVNFSDEPLDAKHQKTTELLTEYCNILRLKGTKASNQLAVRLDKILCDHFTSVNNEQESEEKEHKSTTLKSGK